MQDVDRKTLRELICEELMRYQDDNPEDGTRRSIYGATDDDGRWFVNEAISFVLLNRDKCSLFSPRPGAQMRFNRQDQGRLAIIATYLLTYPDVLDLTHEMCERAAQLRSHAHDDNIPSLLRQLTA